MQLRFTSTDFAWKGWRFPNHTHILRTWSCRHNQHSKNLNMEETTVLFRPVGENELRLIVEARYRGFPPRLPGQPIFYPVLNEEYAIQIARDWNAKNSETGVGIVTKFRVKTAYLSKF